jgi:hypothetical protein
MSAGSSSTGKTEKFITISTLIVAVINLFATAYTSIYVAQIQGQNDVILAEYNKKLLSTQFQIDYSENEGDLIFYNLGKTEASEVQIQIVMQMPIDYTLLADSVVPNEQIGGNTNNGGEFIQFKINKISPRQQFAVRLNIEASPEDYPLRSAFQTLNIYCSNCPDPPIERR